MRKPTTGRQSPYLFDKWHGIFYMPSCIDEAGHTKAFDYPVAEHWGGGGNRNVQPREDSNRQHIGSQSNALPTEPSRLPYILYISGLYETVYSDVMSEITGCGRLYIFTTKLLSVTVVRAKRTFRHVLTSMTKKQHK